jgi:hypothetical protein
MLPVMPTAAWIALVTDGVFLMLLANIVVWRANPGRRLPLAPWGSQHVGIVQPWSWGMVWWIGFFAYVVGGTALVNRIGDWFWLMMLVVAIACGPFPIWLRNRRLRSGQSSPSPS